MGGGSKDNLKRRLGEVELRDDGEENRDVDDDDDDSSPCFSSWIKNVGLLLGSTPSLRFYQLVID